jgi:hypothetical protein
VAAVVALYPVVALMALVVALVHMHSRDCKEQMLLLVASINFV